MTAVRRNNVWARLKRVVVGSYPTAQHFAYISSRSIREPLMRLADEINQDLDNFADLLMRHGCEVIRPEVMPVEQFQEFLAVNKRLPEPPLQVRNTHVVTYDTLLRLGRGPREIDQLLDNYGVVDLSQQVSAYHAMGLDGNRLCYNNDTKTWFRRSKYQELAGPDWPDFYDYVQGTRSSQPHIAEEMSKFEPRLAYEAKEFSPLDGPNVIPLPEFVVVDSNEFSDYSDMLAPYVVERVQRINTTAGHTDGCFMILGNQTIIGINEVIDYQKYFADFDVIKIPDSMYGDVMQWRQLNRHTPRWWIDNEDDNAEMHHFIDTYMQDYVGNVYETLFDVNVLSLDNNVVCISNDKSSIRRQLEQRGIDTIVVPWRHQFFVDGGLHCITLDLCRADA